MSSASSTRADPQPGTDGADGLRGALPRRYRLQVGANYLYTISLVLVAIGVTPVLVRKLGTTEYGIWVLVGSLALYLELLEFGFGGATIRKVANYHSLADQDRVRSAVATSFWFLSGLGALALVVGGLIALFFPVIFDIPAELETAARVLTIVVAVDLALSIPLDTFGGTLIGLQRYELVKLSLTATLLVQAGAWVAILFAGGGLIELGIATVAIGIAGQVSRYLLARRLLPGLSISLKWFDRKLVKPLAGLSTWFSISEVSSIINSRIDPIVVGIVVGVPEAGIYAIGQKLADSCVRFVWPLTTNLFPWSSALAAREDRSGIRNAIVLGTRITIGMALPLGLVVGLLASPAIDAWIGGGIADAAKLVVILLVANAVVKAVPQAGITVLRGAGDFRLPALAMSVEAALNIGLSVGLGLMLGIKGVAIGSLIATASVRLVFFVWYIGRHFELRMQPLLLGLARAHALPSAVVAIMGAVLLRLGISGLGPVVGVGLMLIFVYVSILLVTGTSHVERARMREALRARRERRRAETS